MAFVNDNSHLHILVSAIYSIQHSLDGNLTRCCGDMKGFAEGHLLNFFFDAEGRTSKQAEKVPFELISR